MEIETFKSLLLPILGAFLGGNLLLYILSPVYNFSNSPNRIIIKSIGDMFILIFLKVISFAFLVILSNLAFPLLNIMDSLLISFFDVKLDWNFYEALIVCLYISIFSSIIFLLISEFRSRRKKWLVLHKGPLNLHFPEMHRAQIDNRLKGVDLYLSGGEELVAYTYGGLFIKPRIVISKIFLSSGWNAQLASVLLHELNHIERKDTFWLLILHGYDVIIRNSLKLLLFIVTLLGKIPLIGMIAIPFLFLIQMMKEIWGMVLGFGNIISRKSEEYADTESHSLVRSFYLVEALRDVLNGKIRHYTFKNDEEIVRVIYDEEHTNIDENEGFFKSLFDLKSSHPSFKNRVTIAATYSDALLTKSVKETWRIQSIIILIIVLLPFGYIICDEILKTVEYKFNNKEVVEYIQYLERKNED